MEGLLSAGGSVLNVGANLAMEGSRRGFARKEAGKQRKWASDEAQLARDFALEMSSTEVQRRRADMEAAGINPMLAMGEMGGAGVQSPMAGGGASAQAPHGDVGLDFTSAAQLTLQAGLVKAQMRDVNSAADLKIIDAQTRAATNVAQIDKTLVEIEESISRTKLNAEQLKQVREQTQNLRELRTQIIESTKNLRAERGLTNERTQDVHLDRTHKELGLNKAKSEARAEQGIEGNIRTTLRTLGSLLPKLGK